jgi:predicted enzyme related to lactoylglutathione lyase
LKGRTTHDHIRRVHRLRERRSRRSAFLRRPPRHDPSFETPGYITFELGPGADLAVWSGRFEDLSADVPRTSEVCLATNGGPDEVNAIFKQWQSKGVTILQEPHDAGFGLTFLAADPDGNRIRVAPRG